MVKENAVGYEDWDVVFELDDFIVVTTAGTLHANGILK
jgi:hypothetical protein